MAVIDELVIIEKGESKIVDSAEDGIIDEIEIDNNTFHFAKENEVTNGVCDNAVAEPIIDMQVMGNSVQDGTPTPEVPIEVESVGEKSKNLFNKNKITKGKNLNANTGGLYDSATRGVSDYIPVCANQTYNVDFGIGYQNFINQNSTPYSVLYNSDLTFNSQTAITRTTTGYYFTSPINGFIRLNFYIDMEDYVQLEVGSTVTEYEPYGYKIPVKVSNNTEEITTNIYLNEPLRKVGDYADYIDYKNKKVVRNIKLIELDNNANWSIYTSVANHFQVSVGDNYYNIDANLVMSNYYQAKKDNGIYNWSGDYGVMSVDGSRIRFKNKDFTELDEWKNWLSSLETPLSVIYRLEIPKEETIELPEIATLDGTTIFNIETTIKPSEFKVTYWRQITP